MKSYKSAKGPSQRQLQVAENIRHILSMILHRLDFHDEVLSKYVVNISEVRMTPDLKWARVYVLALQHEATGEVVKALNELSSKIRHLMSKELTIKFMPKLHFVADDAFFEASRVDALLNSPHVKQDLVKEKPHDQEPEQDQEEEA
jgi:ribosome-binding factor A